MRKKIVLATSAVVITAGSIFAFGSSSEKPIARSFAEQCPVECCIGNEESCETTECCAEEGTTCCIPMQ